MDAKNELAGAVDGVAASIQTAHDIALVLATWSKRHPQRISAHEQREIHRLFRETHRQLAKAEHELNSRLQEEPQPTKPPQGSRYRVKQTQFRVGAL